MAIDETALMFPVYTPELLSIGLQTHLIDTTERYLRDGRNTLNSLPVVKQAKFLEERDTITTRMSEMRTQKDFGGHIPMRFHDPIYTMDQTLCRQT